MQQERSPKTELWIGSLRGHPRGLLLLPPPLLVAVVGGEQVERRFFFEARPIVWVTGKALLAGTFSARWVDVMAAARLSQSVEDSPFFFWLKMQRRVCV